MIEPVIFNRDMGYSAAEFYRILPAAIRDYDLHITGNEVVITPRRGNHQLRLLVTPLPDRILANMRLPHIDVRFEFLNFSEQQRKDFMQAFDRSYQRGGG